MAKSLLTTGYGDGGQPVNQNLTRYYSTCNGALQAGATETDKQITFRQGGVLSNLYVLVTANTVVGSTTFRTRVNGANGAQSVSITGLTAGEFEDTTNTDTIAAGDEVNYQMVVGAAGTNLSLGVISSVFDATSNTVSILATGTNGQVNVDSVTRYVGICGDPNNNATESQVKYQFSNAGTLQKLFVNVSANTRTTDTTFKSRINGSDGAQSVLFGSGVTGILEDTSNTDTIVDGDIVNSAWVTGSGGNAITCQNIKYEFTTINSSFNMGFVLQLGMDVGGGTSYTSVGFFANSFGGPGNTEAHMKTEANFVFTASRLWVSVTAFGTSCTLNLRVNAGDSALTVSPSGTGEFEDTTHTVDLVATDEIDFKCVAVGGVTIKGVSMIGVVGVPTSIKTIMGLAKASVKTFDDLAIASVKTVEGLA